MLNPKMFNDFVTSARTIIGESMNNQADVPPALGSAHQDFEAAAGLLLKGIEFDVADWLKDNPEQTTGGTPGTNSNPPPATT